MKTTFHHAGRTIRKTVGLAGQVSYEVTGAEHSFTLVGSAYGTPGPVTIVLENYQDHVSAAHRFGDVFDLAFVRRWIDDEDEAKALLNEALRTPSAIDLACPACNAQPGKPCTAPTDTSHRAVGWMHASRCEAANNH